jgi:hypothetical protein
MCKRRCPAKNLVFVAGPYPPPFSESHKEKELDKSNMYVNKRHTQRESER